MAAARAAPGPRVEVSVAVMRAIQDRRPAPAPSGWDEFAAVFGRRSALVALLALGLLLLGVALDAWVRVWAASGGVLEAGAGVLWSLRGSG